MAAFPTRNKTLKFVMQNGIVNLYMLLMTFFFEPYSVDDFSYEKEGAFDEHIRTSSSNNSSGGNGSFERASSQDRLGSSPSRGLDTEQDTSVDVEMRETNRGLNLK